MTLKRALYALLTLFIILNLYAALALWLNLGVIWFLTPLSTLIGLAFAVLHAGQRLGWRRALTFMMLTFVISLAYESIGVATGWVYGPYHYTEKLGIKFLGLVPLLIPAAWFMMMYPSYVIAEQLFGGLAGWRRTLAIAALGGVIMTAWDVVMDPMMVASGHWVWDVQGAYFGVPLQNYWGWWLTVFTVFVLFLVWMGKGQANMALDRLAIASYAVTAFSSILISLDPESGLGGSALAGLFAMLPWVVLGWRQAA